MTGSPEAWRPALGDDQGFHESAGGLIMPWQTDLFDAPGSEPDDEGIARLRPVRSSRRTSSTAARMITPETAAKILEGSDDFRVLRRLRPPEVSAPRPLMPDERLAVIVDTETTGLDHRHDEVVEIGMIAFIHDAQGAVVDVVGSFNALREPSRPISPEITRLTGITDAMVEGQKIDLDAVETFIADADLVIAHNAGFDRPFCERLTPGFGPKAWAYSVKEVDWAAFGYEGSKLGYLVGQSGLFHTGHRAIDDCHALLEVLAAPLAERGGSALASLFARSEMDRIRIWAEGAPYDLKDQLRQRGYRWSDGSDGRPRPGGSRWMKRLPRPR